MKGRFAFGYASHPDRVMKPLMREKITDQWREVEWEEAIGFVGRRMREIQDQYGVGAIGGINLVPLYGRRGLCRQKKWSGPRLATTMWTPAPGSATRRPVTA
ncbi:molybdopterin-dependent oxidoreductase [Fodinicola feengrottensis]|uniref:molybdopterin-dependent oxidoreductase n=1 Tax=Fodinicola feengrottensis TaxID=435914 RepID=UPI002442465E|nr:molybdopterin-dependent oxidoreductase [Fodinicola feengrottensis]